jgi:signal transduction histidine kinase
VKTWLPAADLESGERARRARLLTTVLIALLVMGFGAMVSALLDPRNPRGITLVFFLGALALMSAFIVAVRRGYVTAVAWATSLVFWVMIAAVLPFFGGMSGHNGAAFAVSIVLIGSLVGSRPAIVMALASCVWSATVATLEVYGRLPPQLGPYTPFNAWNALAVTLVLTTVLVQSSLESLRALNARVVASANERDEALRRSIDSQKLQLVGSLTSGIAHDFNNLLTVIGSTAAHLRHTVSSDAEANEVLDDLDAATLRATLITRQLLAFGRGESVLETIDLSSAVRSLEPLLPRLLGSPITVKTDVQTGALVTASRAGVEQILLNLAVNSRDAMPQGGTLTLQVHQEGDSVVLRVADTGVGMDEVTRAKALEPFFTTKPTGTGLGLSTVRSLVERFNGALAIHSQQGKGTTIEVRLPLQKLSGPTTVAGLTPQPPHRAGARALLVEDDALVRRSTVRLLEGASFDVVAVANGREALALLEHTRDFSVVVTDIAMPELDGEALARQLAGLYPTLPVVLYSGNRQPADDVLAASGRAFVEKPASAASLLAAINTVRPKPTSG